MHNRSGRNRVQYQLARAALLGGIAIAISACSDSPTGNPDPGGEQAKGILRDAPVGGVAYSTSSGLSGVTNVAGEYNYREGDVVTFKLGGLTLGSATATGVVTPLDLAAGSANKLTNLLVLFQSLDGDGNPSNGISIPAAAAAAVTTGMDLTSSPTTFASASNTVLVQAKAAAGLTAPIVTPTQAADHFKTQALALLSAEVWGMATATTAIIVRVSPNGEYVMAEARAAGGGGQPGIENGTVGIGGFDVNGYWLNPATTINDTNGQWGFSHPGSCERFAISNTAITERTCQGNTVGTIPKMENNQNSLVGMWAIGSTTSPTATIVAFFSNGRYIIVTRPPEPDDCGHAGVEFGQYTYNAAAGTLRATSITYDTDGCGGINSTLDGGTIPVTLQPGGATSVFNTGGGSTTAYRLSSN